MANSIILKRSATPGKVPTTAQLSLGEIAINTYDGLIYIKKDDGTPSVVQIGGITSVNGETGAVTLDTGDIAENGNLYFTNARARSALSAGTGISYNSTTGAISTTQNLTTAGSPTFAGMTLTGNVTITGDIVPTSDNIYSLGSPTMQWKDVFVGPGSLYVNGVEVIHSTDQSMNFTADTDQNMRITTTGAGVLQLGSSSTNVNIDGTLQIASGKNITDSAGVQVNFGDNIQMNGNKVVGLGAPSSANDAATKTYVDTQVAAISTSSISQGNSSVAVVDSGTGTVTVTVDGSTALTVDATGVTVAGNFTVSGTQTVVNSNTINLADNIITLNSDHTGAPTQNAGLLVERGDEADAQLRWNEGTDKWTFTNDGAVYYPMPVSTTDLAEGTSLYFTDARARGAISASSATGVSYNSTTGAISLGSIPNSSLSNSSITINGVATSLGGTRTLDTDSISEGTTNLYHTTARARSAVSAGTGISYNSTTGVISTSAIPNASLANSSVTVGTTAISLGASSTTLAGLTSVTSTSFTGDLTGNADTATSAGKWTTGRTLTLGGDLTGSVSIDGSANATLTATIAANSVALGTDTTGDYVSSLVAGTGITLSNNTGESATPTIAVDTSTIATQSWVTSQIATKDNTDEITEGTTNLYFTNARARSALSGSTGISYNSSTGAIAIDSTVATLTGTQTLTNKTLTLPTIGSTGAVFNGSTSGTTTVLASATAGTTTITLPATTGTVVTTGDTGTVTNAMLAGSIANAKLSNSSVTVGTTAISLGSSSTTLAGLTSVTSTGFTGALTGNASTATTLQTARNIQGVSFDGSANITVVTAGTGISVSGTTVTNTDLGSSQNIYKNITDGTTTAAAGSNSDTFKFRATGGATVTVGSNDATHGDNLLIGLSAIPNSSLANSSITVNGTSISLGSSGSITTSAITEGTNLYYTDARARAAVSFTAGSGAYNSSTGVFTIPTNTNQLTNGASYITLSSLSAGTGISYSNSTGVISSTITQYTDALARAAVSAGTGISYNSSTGVITNSDLGSSQNIFKNFTDGTTTAAADSNSDTFKFRGSAGVTVAVASDDATHGDSLLISLSSVPNSSLANSTISGVALGSTLGTLTMGVSGTGLSGSTTYNGSGAATFTVTSNATNANTASTIVARDASGNFTAGTITATLSGTASNATTAGGLSVHSGTNNEANKIVRTDGNGYIQAGWINTTSGDNGTTAIDRVYASSDGYIRYYTPANFRTVLDVPTRGGSGASGTWSISVTGSAGSATTATNQSGGTVSATTMAASGAVTMTANTTSTSKTTGTLVVTGGVGISGALYVGGEVTAYASDASLKTNVVAIGDALSKVEAIRGVSYDWNEAGVALGLGTSRQVGVIAQEVEAVLPELVVQSAHEGYKTVKYDKLTALLIEAVKDLSAKVKTLEAQLGNKSL